MQQQFWGLIALLHAKITVGAYIGYRESDVLLYNRQFLTKCCQFVWHCYDTNISLRNRMHMAQIYE